MKKKAKEIINEPTTQQTLSLDFETHRNLSQNRRLGSLVLSTTFVCFICTKYEEIKKKLFLKKQQQQQQQKKKKQINQTHTHTHTHTHTPFRAALWAVLPLERSFSMAVK